MFNSDEKKDFFRGIGAFVFIVILVFVSFILNRPPEVVGTGDSQDRFSAERAMVHLKEISKEKHPLGSEANDRVREYIIKEVKALGFEPVIEKDQVFVRKSTLVDVVNISVTVKGKDSSKSVFVAGHYDSVPDSYGASDDGSAIVTMLETLRILKDSEQLKNDIVFLFTDGEELGLIGAKAFMKNSPMAKNIGVVLNFEASGTSGQSLMFETSKNNYWLISNFAKAVKYPAADSLSYEIYRMMPNDTDLTVFKNAGIEGFNFAYIDNRFDYHTEGDNYENTDPRSVQHHGEYCLSLVKHFGNIDLNHEKTGNAVYFNTIGNGFVYYSYSLITPIMIFTVLLLLLVLFTGVKKSLMSPAEIGRGLLGTVLHLATVGVGATLFYIAILKSYTWNDRLLTDYFSNRILLGIVLAAVAFSLVYFRYLMMGVKLKHALYMEAAAVILVIAGGFEKPELTVALLILPLLIWFVFRKGCSSWNIMGGGFTLWGILTVLLTIYVPGGSYILTWPLILVLTGSLINMYGKEPEKRSCLQMGIFTSSAVIPILWFTFFAYMIHLAMKLNMVGATMAIVSLLIYLLIPHIELITEKRPWCVAIVLIIASITVLFPVFSGLEYSERYKMPGYMIYATNGNSNETAIYTPYNINEWTKRYFGESPQKETLSDFFRGNNYKYFVNKGEYKPLPLPEATVVSDTTADGKRVLELLIKPGRKVHYLRIYLKRTDGMSFSFGEREFTSLSEGASEWYRLNYFGIREEGVKLRLSMRADSKAEISLNSIKYGLPPFNGFIKRPGHMMSTGDKSIAAGKFVF